MTSSIENTFEPNNIHVSCDELCSKDKTILFATSPYSSSSSSSSSSTVSNYAHQQYHHNQHHHHLFSSSSSHTSSNCSTSSSSASSRTDSVTKSDFHIVGGKIRPTLKCIRNTLNLGIDSTKRYDRLSSSKSDLHLPVNELSVDDSDVHVSFANNQSNKSHVISQTKSPTTPVQLETNILNCVDMLPMSGNSGESKFGSNSSSMLLPSTNTFRSFIKTKSSGIIRKDNGDKDDEEAEQLCESETSKVSNECTTPTITTNSAPQFECLQYEGRPTYHHGSNPTDGTLVTASSPSCAESSYSNVMNDPNPPMAANRLNACQSIQMPSCCCAQHGANPHQSPQHHKVCSSESVQMYNTPPSIVHKADKFYVTQMRQAAANGKSNGKRHSRSALIPPILKPNRFVKQTKGNLLFNVNSKSHKSQTKKILSTENIYSDSSREIVESLKTDRMVMTQPDEDRRRRTIIIEKLNNSFGFTLQTYGIKHSSEGEVELITYVDEVTYGGPAFRGGMRPGDVILSINGRDVEKADHRTLVNYINSCEKTMRLVVLFEDCVRKIELNLKYIKLKKALQQKQSQLEILNQRENQILLNAALRECSQDQNKQTDNGNDLGFSDNKENLTNLKKYKCKSLDNSLNEINSKNDSPVATEWTEEATYESDNEKCKNSVKLTADVPKEHCDWNQDQYEPDHENDDERQTLHDEQRKTSQSRSKSLPHSIANSLDCLTNEAYEDDENLVTDFVAKKSSDSVFGDTTESIFSKYSHNGAHQAKNTSTMSTSDKDFITKL